ncbi:hypothetical protein C7974DRAFT_423151 [Boeremia exigua]|uniref:uncharacterized protein n=1 Tax=Boeremia exigua TaxID=749465 RepID=UPI001E8D016F|nr:uncharacterized protein C7974DRAFT_423151 [Boeremia exigua]KAH6638246.1 hypothetical protein C7974DRAFT_423151 [Boeremia exigua]
MAAQQSPDMQVAQILSDLMSLRAGVCDPAAALALVSARPQPAAHTPDQSSAQTTAQPTAQEGQEEQDPDLRRAKDLVALHYGVRERCRTGALGRTLAGARGDVERAMGGA